MNEALGGTDWEWKIKLYDVEYGNGKDTGWPGIN